MAQQQLVAHRVGRELLPALPDNLAAQFGTWALNWARDHPNEIANMARDATQWIRDNAPGYANRAWHMTQAMQERAGAILEENARGWSAYLLEGTAGLDRWGNNGERPTTVAIDSQGNIPDLGDLIPENTRSQTRRINSGTMESGKRPAEGPPAGQPEAQRLAAASSGGGGMNPVSKETPITPYDNLTYGLPETHTTLNIWNGYMSVVGSDLSTPTVLEFRMTQPHDCLNLTLSPMPTGVTQPWSKGVFPKKFNDSSKVTDAGSVSTTASFPATLPSGASTTERAAWFSFWAKQYEYFTVLACHWEIVMHNPNTTTGTDVLVGWDYNSFSTTAGGTGNRTPQDQPLHTMMQWKRINFTPVESEGMMNSATTGGGRNPNSTKVLSGTYYPGMAARNIANDGDVKTWVATGAPTATSPASTTLQEFLTLYFYSHPMNHLPQTVGTSNTNGVNVKVTLKYVVQFKDLYVTGRYPNNTTTNITLVLEDDVINVP